MNQQTPVEKIRQAIAWQLSNLGVADVSDLRETMLIQNGLYCGRKFQCQAFEVVWFLEEDEIKFFSPSTELLHTTSALLCIEQYQTAAEQSDRRAA